MDILHSRWIVVDGSVYTEQKEVVLSPLTKKPIGELQRAAVAFNVGAVAQHIADLHNQWYDTSGPGSVKIHNV